MNILPKKRWHVRTKDNIARVRRDEAEAAEQEKERIHRAKLAEQESRTAFLRDKARTAGGKDYNEVQPKKVEHVQPKKVEHVQPKKSDVQPTSSKNIEANIYTSDGNINFFKDIEDGKQTTGTNKEHEAEKKAEQEKYEKSIGYLTYLGQDSLESKGEKAWYVTHSVAKGNVSDTEANDEEVGLKSKSKMDPINDIIKYTGLKPMKKVVTTSTCIPKVAVDQGEVKVLYSSIVDQGKEKRLAKKKSSSTKKRKHLSSKSKKRKKEHKKKHRKDGHRRKKKKHKDTEKEKPRIVEDSECHHRGRDRKHEVDTSLKRKRHYSTDSGDSHSRKRRDRKRHYSSSTDDTKNHRRRDSSDSGDSRSRKRRDRSRHYSSSSGTDGTKSNYTSSSGVSDDEEERKERQKKLEVLRAERLKREAEERKRAERLLAGQKPDAIETLVTNSASFQQKYNSQYNPHIARQNQENTQYNPLDAKQNQETTTLAAGVKYWLQ